MASRDVYTMKEFMEIISIQEQTCIQKSRYEQSQQKKQKQKEGEVDDDDDDDDKHPLVTEMFGELYFRESPTSTLEGLFSPPRIGSPAAEEPPSEEAKAASDDDDGSDEHGSGKDDQTHPELASSPDPN